MAPTTPDAAARTARRKAILAALRAEGRNRSRAARRLGYKHIGDLMRAIRMLGLKIPKGKPGRPKKK